MTIREFWRSTSRVPRIAFWCAAVAGALNVGTYGGLSTSGLGSWLLLAHLGVLALGLALFVRIGYHQLLTLRFDGDRQPASPFPAPLIWVTVGAFLYLLLMFFGVLAVYGEGNAQIRDGREVWMGGNRVVRELEPGSVALFEARTLRVFSSAWLFFGLLIGLTWHRIDERIRNIQARRGPVT